MGTGRTGSGPGSTPGSGPKSGPPPARQPNDSAYQARRARLAAVASTGVGLGASPRQPSAPLVGLDARQCREHR